MVGGYGVNGPSPTIEHVLRPKSTEQTSALEPEFRFQRVQPIQFPPSLPATFPLGIEGTSASMVGRNLVVCSPGAQIVGPSLDGSAFRNLNQPSQPRVIPGSCFAYSTSQLNWRPFGSPMNTFRGGSSVTRMGRFIVATGKVSSPYSFMAFFPIPNIIRIFKRRPKISHRSEFN